MSLSNSVLEGNSQNVFDQKGIIVGGSENGNRTDEGIDDCNVIEVLEISDDKNVGINTSNTKRQKRILRSREIDKTFRIMAFRKSERQVIGRYRRQSVTRVFWTMMFMIAFLSLMGAGVGGNLVNSLNRRPFQHLVKMARVCHVDRNHWNYDTILQITEVTRWCFYWIAIATVILLIINHGSLVNETSDGFASTKETKIILLILVILESLTLTIWVIVRYAYPRIVKNAYWLDTIRWWRIKEASTENLEGDAVGCFRYFAWESYSFWFRHGYVTYVGEVDGDGRPHGRGEWVDDSFDGECLKGIWEHGIPIGPFQSRGSGTGDAFHAVRVGFVKNRCTPWYEKRFYPRPFESGLDVGVAAVECSVSGKYLKYLPRASLIVPPKSRYGLQNNFNQNTSDTSPDILSCNSSPNNLQIEHCLENLTTFVAAMGSDSGAKEQSSIIIRLEDEVVNITGYYPIDNYALNDQVIVKRVPRREESNMDSQRNHYTLEVEGWKQSDDSSVTNKECIIFIHGFNCSTKFAMETLGQFLVLADLPNYIKPFVFSPPGINAFWYFSAQTRSCSEESINEFRTFLQQLQDLGFHAVHIIGHSLGCMVVLNYVKAFEGIFTVHDSSRHNTKLETSYEFDRSDPMSSHENIHHIPVNTPTMKLSSVILLNPAAPLDFFVDHGYSQLYKYCDHITIYTNSRDFALKMGEILSKKRSLGRQVDDIYSNGKLIDIDLIDTTQLDVNIHKIRHNFFNLNRLLVDDLWDIIVMRKRASERKSKLNRKERHGRGGIVYTFLVAPSYVVNK
ncbi:18595_t:CDS:2 [Acaulospora morrowiae]|uniref:18595_t:CDS:1 n=1 Tax=Acaulospora morrowiae TaxID=94023 RepID=A0A9N9FGK9_9GLOM|nr:18595_t:CDS:2 [Acaulospora morrowiae]